MKIFKKKSTQFAKYGIHLPVEEAGMFIFMFFLRGWLIFSKGVISNLCIMGFDSDVQCVLAVGLNKTELTNVRQIWWISALKSSLNTVFASLIVFISSAHLSSSWILISALVGRVH